MPAILTTRKLCKTFSHGGLQQHVLKNLDMEINEGDFTVIMGSSGAGKSTLLYALSGMDQPTLGEIDFDGQEISSLSNDRLAVFRRTHCGFVFQQVFLMDSMSVMDNVLACGLLVNTDRRALFACAKALFKRVGLSETDWEQVSFPTLRRRGAARGAGTGSHQRTQSRLCRRTHRRAQLRRRKSRAGCTDTGTSKRAERGHGHT